MNTTARIVLGAFLLLSLYAVAHGDPIDRHALVSRHDVIVHQPDPMGTLAVGNGDFAFNADITGAQSFPDYYQKTMPIGILSDWGWHRFPNPQHFTMADYPMKTVEKRDRTFVYPASGTSHPTTQAAYLRTNPNRFGLAQIGFLIRRADGSTINIAELAKMTQHLELWNGELHSQFTVDDQLVNVLTIAHPDRDELAIRVESPLIASGRLKIRIAFPYVLDSFGPDYQDWQHPEAHSTVMTPHGDHAADFARTMDDAHYAVRVGWNDGSTLKPAAPHEYLLSSSGGMMECVTRFSPTAIDAEVDSVDAVQKASAEHWKQYWSTGGAIDLSGNTDPRAAELERRIVLSEYVMAVHDGGSHPPQETGLGVNSWYGKYHMEMYWWHAAHWALWGRPEYLEKSLDSLNGMMGPGEQMARLEKCSGVKWSKMTDPSGEESPSGVGPVLVWQQPHPIFLAELIWRARHDEATLKRYQKIVFETADYMASFVDYDAARKEYVLGPGVSSGDEKHTDVAHNLNPTMEVGYWRWALQTAQAWRVRMHLEPDAHWQDVIDHLARPTVRDGVYPALEFPVESKAAFMPTWLLGVLGVDGIDRQAMSKTLHDTTAATTKLNAVTWGTSMAAMCAARLGETDRAVDLLSSSGDVNPFRPSGYAVRRPEQTPMYFPANGGWLSAVAMMAAGWDGNTQPNPGFPAGWSVRWEGLLPLP